MLSPKARAFSVDQLLSKRESQQKTTDARDKEFTHASSEKPEYVCQSFGDEKPCHHQPVSETSGKQTIILLTITFKI